MEERREIGSNGFHAEMVIQIYLIHQVKIVDYEVQLTLKLTNIFFFFT